MKASGWMILAVVVIVGGGAALLLAPGANEAEPTIAAAAGGEADAASAEPASAAVVMPEALSRTAETGQVAFADNCAACHGTDGGGTNQGPPLIHAIYEPGHHSDLAFVLAARNGSRAHHWRFGDMPPQPQVSDAEIATIIQFVREVQQANGIF